MKKISSLFLSLLAGLGVSLGGQASAQDSFDREFSKFDKDFERLNRWKTETPASNKLKRAPAPVSVPSATPDGVDHTVPLNDDAPDAASKPAASSGGEHPAGDDVAPARSDKTAPNSGLPKGAKVEKLSRADRLGNQISDPVMRKKVQDLYKRPDVVVQQYVLPTN